MYTATDEVDDIPEYDSYISPETIMLIEGEYLKIGRVMGRVKDDLVILLVMKISWNTSHIHLTLY